MTCKRCWHNIGEHYLCLDHGGEGGWTKGAYKIKPKPAPETPPPGPHPEAYGDPWFDFLDRLADPKPRLSDYSAPTLTIPELVP